MQTFSFLSPDGCLVNLDGNKDMYDWQSAVSNQQEDVDLSETSLPTADSHKVALNTFPNTGSGISLRLP